jgi:hypothetical protein
MKRMPSRESGRTGVKLEDLLLQPQHLPKPPEEEIPDSSVDNVCSVCETGGPDDELLLCGGFCLRAFHAECLDMDEESIPRPNVYWSCFDCQHGLQRCFTCKQYERTKRMVKCEYSGPDGHCGHYFHAKCIDDYKTTPSSSIIDGLEEERPPYVCQQHHCHTCKISPLITTTTATAPAAAMSKCFKCDVAYCENCRPGAVHVLDDRRYFTCVKHVQDTSSLPPIPIRFMERLVTTRLRSRMRCPSKYKVLVEKDDLKAEHYETQIRKAIKDNKEKVKPMTEKEIEQELARRKKEHVKSILEQNVQLDDEQEQLQQLLASTHTKIKRRPSNESSKTTANSSSSTTTSDSFNALPKRKDPQKKNQRPKKKARIVTNLMPSRRDLEQYQPKNANNYYQRFQNQQEQQQQQQQQQQPYPPVLPEVNIDSLPFGMHAKKRSYEEMNSSSSSSSSGGGSSSSSNVPMSMPPALPIPAAPTKSISEVRSDLLNLVELMLNDQRAKVEKLRISVTCNGEV